MAERSEASTALNARTRVRAKKIWQRALPKPERGASCALNIGIHPDSNRSTYFFVSFFLLLLSQVVTGYFIHHLAKLLPGFFSFF